MKYFASAHVLFLNIFLLSLILFYKKEKRSEYI